jgi:signal transduction histidine kinase
MLIVFLVILVDFKCSAKEAGALKLSRDSSSYDLQKYLQVIEIDVDSIQISELLPGRVNNWQSLGTTTPNKIYWGKVSLYSTDSSDINYVLEFGLNSYIDLYVVSKGLVISYQQSGELVPIEQKILNYDRRSCLFGLTIPAKSEVDVYFKIRSALQQLPNIDPKITLAMHWHQTASNKWSLQWMYQGFLGAFVICSLAIFFLEREKIYIYFFTYAFSLSLYLAWYSGILHVMMPFDYPLFNSYFMLIGGLIPICYMLFIESLITSSSSEVNLKRLIQIALKISMAIAILIIFIYGFTLDRKLVLLILYNVIIAQVVFGLYLLVKLYLTKQIINRLLVFGSFIFMIVVLSALIGEYYFHHPGALYYIQLGSILELIIFSVAIGYRIKIITWERKKTHALAILQYEKNEALQKELNDQLGETITRKELELEQKNIVLNNTIKELQISNKGLNDFAHVVSHDLKAPLRGIHSLTKFLTEDHGENLNKDAKNLISLITKRISKMDFLINGVLGYSRISNKKQEHSDLDTNQLVKETIELLEIPSKINIEITGVLPVIHADSVQIQQVFQNLIGNSIKFIGQNKGKVEISHKENQSQWEFTIRDNGPGIDSKHFERIFGIFQTLYPSEDELISSGVGLAIVKKIIELHGGEIKVISELGSFTEFRFIIPKTEK